MNSEQWFSLRITQHQYIEVKKPQAVICSFEMTFALSAPQFPDERLIISTSQNEAIDPYALITVKEMLKCFPVCSAG